MRIEDRVKECPEWPPEILACAKIFQKHLKHIKETDDPSDRSVVSQMTCSINVAAARACREYREEMMPGLYYDINGDLRQY